MAGKIFVCVVDDDPSVLTALDRLLRSADFEVSMFDSGEALVGSLAGRAPDLLIVDINLPRMDGFEVRDRVRASDASTPIVFITAEEGALIEQRVGSDSRSTLVRKPFEADRLLAAIDGLMTEPIDTTKEV